MATTMDQAVDSFLKQQKIAVAGVSRNGQAPGNAIYKKLKGAGYQVFALNPQATEIEGEPCYPSLSALPQPVDGVMITTPPQATEQIVQECAELGIEWVWMHRSFGQGSVSEPAVAFCRQHNINVIPGGCPMMFCQPVDIAHKCMRWFLGVTGGLPKQI